MRRPPRAPASFVQVLPALQHSAVAACFRCYPPARVRRPGLHLTGQVRVMAGVVAEEKEIPQTEQVVRSLEPAGAIVWAFDNYPCRRRE